MHNILLNKVRRKLLEVGFS